jgi:hypothetical protein
MESVNTDRQIAAMYGAGVTLIQQMLKWCCYFLDWLVVCHRYGQNWLTVSAEHISCRHEQNSVGGQSVILKQLELAFNFSDNSIWGTVHERLGCHKVCSR